MADRKDGVLVMSPPSTMQFLMLSLPKKACLSNTSSLGNSSSNINSSSLQLLVYLLAAKESPEKSNQDTCIISPVLSPPNESNIKGYIDYLGICDQEHTIDILMTNGFHSLKVFKSSSLARSDFKALGLTLGVVTMFFNNVAKYERHLASGHI
ncbi:hypothetical protein VP01_657g3 [Puccinia sorghi]|uniref:Uncharacterized protein n=1 Tax=Puccinia sorghi TaxID=27349 RepID=A0A0L6UHE7_9BASI|nr:hypothetical protein VP01_657g3 [Puccinia sorghi]